MPSEPSFPRPSLALHSFRWLLLLAFCLGVPCLAQAGEPSPSLPAPVDLPDLRSHVSPAGSAAVRLKRGRGAAAVGAGITGVGGALAVTGIAFTVIATREEEGLHSGSVQGLLITGSGVTTAFVGVGILLFGMEEIDKARKGHASASPLPPLDPPSSPGGDPRLALRRPQGPAISIQLPPLTF